MGEISGMARVRIAATPYMQLCVKCGHAGLLHQKKDRRDPQRSRKTMGELVRCSKCNCKQFIPPKGKK